MQVDKLNVLFKGLNYERQILSTTERPRIAVVKQYLLHCNDCITDKVIREE